MNAVIAQHRDIADPETGGRFTVKVYESKKVRLPDGSWRHTSIVLRPDCGHRRLWTLIPTIADTRVL